MTFTGPSVPKPLIVFAHADEAQAFAAVPHLVTGIGKVNAMARLATRLAKGDVSEVIVLGTAGMIDDALDLGTVYRVVIALQHDFEFPSDVALLAADATTERITADEWITQRASNETLHGGAGDDPLAVIATGDVFVKDDALRATLTGQGAQLVDMESYAYAMLCHEMGMPIRIFKVPSDFADSATSHETWDDIVARKSHELLQFARSRSLL